MKAIDFRNATWEELQGCLVAMRESVYQAFVEHGPCTTRELAERAGMDLWCVRPRTCELLQLGFVEIQEGPHPAHEGVYRAVGVEVLRERHEAARAAARVDEQMLLQV